MSLPWLFPSRKSSNSKQRFSSDVRALPEKFATLVESNLVASAKLPMLLGARQTEQGETRHHRRPYSIERLTTAVSSSWVMVPKKTKENQK